MAAHETFSQNTAYCVWRSVFYIYAFYAAISDYRTRYISLRVSALIIMAGVAGVIAFNTDMQTAQHLIPGSDEPAGEFIKDLGFRMLPGMALLMVSILSGGAVGAGDAIFIIAAGLYRGFMETVVIVMAAWLICALMALKEIAKKNLGCERVKNGLPFVTAAFPAVIAAAALL